jgi:hypothetical protein
MTNQVIYVGQPKGESITHLGQKDLTNSSMSIEELRQLTKNGNVLAKEKNCFFLRIGDRQYPAGIVIPIGYDEPRFLSIENFISEMQNLSGMTKEMEEAYVKKNVVTSDGNGEKEVNVFITAIAQAKKAQDLGRKVVFKSQCLYSFHNVAYCLPKQQIVRIGSDENGFYYVVEDGAIHYVLNEIATIEECERAEEKAIMG